MGVRTVGLIHDIPTPGHTGGHAVFHEIRRVLRSHYEVCERSFAHGGPRGSAFFYPFLPLARPVGDGLRARSDVVVSNLSGIFPVAGDLVYVQPPPAGEAGSTLVRRLGIGRPPPDGLWPKPVEWLWYSPLTRPLLDAGAYDALDRTGTLVAVSESVRAEIRAELGRDALVVRPCLDQERFEALPGLARPDRSPHVAIVSRIDATKRLGEVVEIANRCPTVGFTLVGRVPVGGERLPASLRDRNTARNLEIVPNAPEAFKRALLGRSAAFLMTSRSEAFATSVIEAVLAGAFPVVHASSGVREVLEPTNLFDDVEGAVDRIRRAVGGELRIAPDLRDRITDIADPRRFEREFVDAVERAAGVRRRP